MVGTQQTTVEGRSALSGLLGVNSALASAELGDSGAFTEAMEEQLSGLLIELGIDPKRLKGIDAKAMLAQLQNLLQGQLTATGGSALPPLDADGLNLPDVAGLNVLAGNAESFQTAKSSSALKLFLQANIEEAENAGKDSEAQAALAALLQQWLAREDQGPSALINDGEVGHEDLDLLLRQWLNRLNPTGETANRRSIEGDAALLAQLRQLFSASQPQDGPTEERLAPLRQLLAGNPPEDGPIEGRSSALLAQLRQLLGASQPQDGLTEERSSALLAQLRQLFSASQPQDGAIDNRLPRPLFDFVAQAVAQRGVTVDSSSTLGFDTAPTDGLALLKASLTAHRGADQTNASAGADSPKAFDLARLLTPDGARQLADRFAMIARARGGVAELKLNPPSLGTMEVRVSMDVDKAHVHFVSANPAVRDVLEAAMPRLREALAQDGLSLGDASVSDQPPQRRGEAGEGAGAEDGQGGTEAEGDGEALMTADGDIPGSTLSALARKLDLFA